MAKRKTLGLPANDINVGLNRSPIDLRIHGSDMFVSGHFHRWQAITTMGRDLDELCVRMAVDVTSPDHLTINPTGQDLFSFHSDTLLQVQPNIYLARGQLTTSMGSRPFEMVLETPRGHTAFCALAFIARKEELGAGWKELVTRDVGPGGIDAERLRDPRAGVRDPHLAAA